ncbi:uncharacterized protein isoform X9 [Choristoneura fumiferana]|uniref:uncharacterized protein isoform X9 n=1 Tax=Choristoneura fumiferana TaxID=7141 RepID=UPI003D1547D8
MRLTSRKQVLDCEERFKDMYSRNLIRGFEVKDEPLLSETEEMKEEIQSMDDEDDDTFLNFNDGDDDLTSDLSATADAERKTRSKGKAKSKPKKAKQDKKTKTKRPIKDDETELTEAAVSGEKKKGYTQFTLTVDEDGTPTYTCDDCGHEFKKRAHFSQHYRHVHLKLRPKLRSCYLCNTKVPAHMRAFHLESVHGWAAPSCGACGKKFAYPFQVQRHHKIVHMGEKSYKCDVCDMMFASQYRLSQHSIKHTSLRRFSCNFCGKAFRWRNNLKTHVMIHLDERAHVCPICEDAFVQQSSLKYHMGKRHPEAT